MSKAELASLTENKMGTKPVFPLLMTMAFPAMLSMLIQSLYNIVDSMFVARISEEALTAVSLAFPIQSFIIAVSVGTGVGCNSLISRKLGEGLRDEANSAVTHGLILAAISSVVFIIFGMVCSEPFIRMFTDSENVVQLGTSYTYIVTIFSFGSLIHITIEKILQATGRMIYPMIFQAVGAIINIILDPILIFGMFGMPAMGVKGAAIATIIAQIISMSMALLTLIFAKNDVKIKIKSFKFKMKMIKDIYDVGFPTIVMYSLGSLLIVGVNVILIKISEVSVAFFGVYFKLQQFIFMPVNGLIQGAMPIMGYNYGAKNRKRLMETLKWSLIVSTIIMAFGNFIFAMWPEFFLRLFDASDRMLEIGKTGTIIISFSYIAAGVAFMYSTLFQAIGKGGYSLLIALLRQGAIILPLGAFLSINYGLIGFWITFPIAEIISAIVSVVLYKKVARENPVFYEKPSA
ncbi:MAG: MATE family efflux transporter [Clostridium sp.]|uniref:MATE family efflux transporter n=1 Tax=Clostridium sp. TaxID=1506 RepID=UPI002FC607A8